MGTIVLHYGVHGALELSQSLGRKARKMTLFCCLSERVNIREALGEVDKELRNGDDRAALGLVKVLQQTGGLKCFGAARQDMGEYVYGANKAPHDILNPAYILHFCADVYSLVPQVSHRLYTLDELKLNGIETRALLSPVDATLGTIERSLQVAALLGGLAAWKEFDLNPQQIFFSSLGLLFLGTLDAVSFGGGISGLMLDTAGHLFSAKYRNRVLQHEAGHFLIAYMLGILPKGYSLTSWEALRKEGSLNVQAGSAFVDFEFLEEINKGKVTSTMLNRFSCIALAGVVTEYLLFGCAEGGLSDINQLDLLFKSLGFTQQKSDSQVRWAVLNITLILRRHEKARSNLAGAMSEGQSVGSCIAIIEETIGDTEI